MVMLWRHQPISLLSLNIILTTNILIAPEKLCPNTVNTLKAHCSLRALCLHQSDHLYNFSFDFEYHVIFWCNTIKRKFWGEEAQLKNFNFSEKNRVFCTPLYQSQTLTFSAPILTILTHDICTAQVYTLNVLYLCSPLKHSQ